MYQFLLPFHNLIRGIIVILFLWALYTTYTGLLKKSEWQENNQKSLHYLAMTLSLQFVIGLTLYFISPITTSALNDFGAAMGNDVLRFFALEHTFYMFLSVGLAHAARSSAAKAEDSSSKFKKAAIYVSLSLITLLLGMPWARSWIPWL